MKLEEARQMFIDQWGAMATAWGIPRSMAQIHAVLLASHQAMNTDDLMLATNFSRGNVSMSIKDLSAWGLVHRSFKPGDRRDYYRAEKDMYIVFQRIVDERRRRELLPVTDLLERLSTIKEKKVDPQALLDFKNVLKDINEICQTTNNFLELIVGSKKSRIIKWINRFQK